MTKKKKPTPKTPKSDETPQSGKAKTFYTMEMPNTRSVKDTHALAEKFSKDPAATQEFLQEAPIAKLVKEGLLFKHEAYRIVDRVGELEEVEISPGVYTNRIGAHKFIYESRTHRFVFRLRTAPLRVKTSPSTYFSDSSKQEGWDFSTPPDVRGKHCVSVTNQIEELKKKISNLTSEGGAKAKVKVESVAKEIKALEKKRRLFLFYEKKEINFDDSKPVVLCPTMFRATRTDGSTLILRSPYYQYSQKESGDLDALTQSKRGAEKLAIDNEKNHKITHERLEEIERQGKEMKNSRKTETNPKGAGRTPIYNRKEDERVFKLWNSWRDRAGNGNRGRKAFLEETKINMTEINLEKLINRTQKRMNPR